jgi:hypothetical protein
MAVLDERWGHPYAHALRSARRATVKEPSPSPWIQTLTWQGAGAGGCLFLSTVLAQRGGAGGAARDERRSHGGGWGSLLFRPVFPQQVGDGGVDETE